MRWPELGLKIGDQGCELVRPEGFQPATRGLERSLTVVHEPRSRPRRTLRSASVQASADAPARPTTAPPLNPRRSRAFHRLPSPQRAPGTAGLANCARGAHPATSKIFTVQDVNRTRCSPMNSSPSRRRLGLVQRRTLSGPISGCCARPGTRSSCDMTASWLRSGSSIRGRVHGRDVREDPEVAAGNACGTYSCGELSFMFHT